MNLILMLFTQLGTNEFNDWWRYLWLSDVQERCRNEGILRETLYYEIYEDFFFSPTVSYYYNLTPLHVRN